MNAMNDQARRPGYPALASQFLSSDHASISNSGDDAQLDWVGDAQGNALVSFRRHRDAAPEAIRAQHLLKLGKFQQSAHLAQAEGNHELAIRLMFDLICEESSMARVMGLDAAASFEELQSQSVIRRADIDLLLTCAEEVGDQEAKLLAELLLKNQQRHCASAIRHNVDQRGLFEEPFC